MSILRFIADEHRKLQAALLARDPACEPLRERLQRDAGAAMTAGPWSVMDKPKPAPSGDWHDFVGYGSYWWPNPATPDGLPYVSRDGENNPESRDYDGYRLRQLYATVTTLAEAAWFLGDRAAGARARLLVSVWFLEPATRMNPHLRYGCHIPGVWEGSGWGIVDTHGLVELLRALALLREAGHWTEADAATMAGWLGAYLDWLLTSEEGRFEADRMNNHATAYDELCCTLALQLDRPQIARDILAAVPYERIGKQLEHNGRQPWEN
ncbi:MAG: alginate lyase family protein, partial [Cephaloticoccus sp.]|nr:alginate lyase family protein [Cephaloticoccus sp.]